MGNPLRMRRAAGSKDPLIRGFVDQAVLVLNSLLSRQQIVRTVVGNVTNWSIRSSVAAGGGLQYNANGELGIKLDQNGNTVLSLGNAGLGLANQTGRTFLASPANGANGPVVFRAIASADLPDLSGVYQPLDADLTSLANATLTNAIYYRGGSGNWAGVTIGGNLTFAGGILSANVPPGVLNIGNGTANATSNVSLLAGSNVQVIVSGNTITLSATSTGGGGNVTVVGGLDPNSSIYPPFTPAGNDDEFNDGTFSGWTAVQNGNGPTITLTETNNVLSILHPGGDSAQHLHAWVKSATIGDGNYVEFAFSGTGIPQLYNIAGLVLSDGSTWGSGNQAVFWFSPIENKFATAAYTGYSVQGSTVAYDVQGNTCIGSLFMRFTKMAANTFRGCVSVDGVSWVNLTGNQSITLSANHAGFFVTSYGGSQAFMWSIRYVKFG